MTPKKKHHHIRHKAGLTVTVAGVRIRLWRKRGRPMVTITSSEAMELRGKKKHGGDRGNQNAKQSPQNEVFEKTADDLSFVTSIRKQVSVQLSSDDSSNAGRMGKDGKKKHGAPLGNQNAKQRDHFDPFVKTADDLASQFGVSRATVERSVDFAKGACTW
jgi:hypothetical protein